MESSFLEGQHGGLLGVASRSFGEHVDALLLVLDLASGTLHSFASVLGVLAIDEDGAAEGHEPAEERNALESGLGGYTAVLGEHGTEHEDIKLGLVVANEDSRARTSKDIVGIFDDEVDAGGEAHNIVEGASGSPLGDLSLTDTCENDGGEDSVEGDNDKGDVGGERASHEGRLGEDEGQHEEADGEDKVSCKEVDEVLGEKVHGLVLLLSWIGRAGARGR